MSLSVAEELREFHRFVGAKLNDSEVAVSPEEALDEWRRLHAASGTANEDLAAIRESLDDLANGDRGVPFEEFDRDFRKRHNLPARS
jgi:hypothetical protein